MDNTVGDQVGRSFRSSHDGVQATRRGRFVIGFAAGTLLAVGIGLLLSPRRSLLRQWLDDARRDPGTRPAEGDGQPAATVATAVDTLTGNAQRGNAAAADTIVLGGDEATRVVVAVKS